MSSASIHFRIVSIFGLVTRVCVGSVRDGTGNGVRLSDHRKKVSIDIDVSEPLLSVPVAKGRRNPQRMRHEKVEKRAHPIDGKLLLQRISPAVSDIPLPRKLSETPIVKAVKNISWSTDWEMSRGRPASRNLSALEIAESSNGKEIRFQSTSTTNIKDKRLLVATVFFIMPAFLGFDRCYMGQFVVGILKGVTFGGGGVLFALDYVAIMYNCLTKKHEMNSLFFDSSFLSETVEPAFWIGIATMAFHAFSVCSACIAKFRGDSDSDDTSLDHAGEGTSPQPEADVQADEDGSVDNDPFAYKPPTEETFGGLPAEEAFHK